MRRKTYTPEFRAEAVRLLVTSEKRGWINWRLALVLLTMKFEVHFARNQR
jgi:transposase-like protein